MPRPPRLSYAWPRAGTPRRPPRPPDHLPARRPRRPARTATTDDEVIAAVREADAAGTPAADHRRRKQPRHRRRGLRRHRRAHRHHRLRTLRHAAWNSPPARSGRTRSPAPSRRASRASSALPVSPAPRARRRSRTWARTGRRSPRPSPRSSPTTAATVRPSPSRTPTAASPTATAASRRTPTRFVVLRVRFELEDAGGLSAPLKYAETARALGVEPGDRVPRRRARETVLKLRAGKGMVLDPEDHDTWSAGSFFTNPILDEGRVRRLPRARHRAPRRRRRAARLPGRRRPHQDLGGLADRPGGLHQGLRHGPRPYLHQAHPGAHQPRRGHHRGPAGARPRGRAGVREAFGVTLVNEPVTVGCAL